MEGANHNSQGRQMNDAGNQYLGVGVEIRAMVAAVASLAAQEAEAGLGGTRQRQECGAPSSPLHILPLLPPVLPSSALPTPALHLLVAGLREPNPPAKTGDLEMGSWASQSWKRHAPSLPCLWTRPQVQGCVPEDPALCTWRCHSRYGQQGAGLAATLLIAFPRLSWPQDSRGMRL